MEIYWSDAEQTNITVVLEDGEQLANVQGPATVTVPPDPGNADYQFIVSLLGDTGEIGPPRTMERPHGPRTAAASPASRRRR